METGLNKALSWEIDNLCAIKDEIKVPFSSGGCDWSLVYYLKDYCGCDYLALFLYAEHPDQPARLGWKRRVRFGFVLSNQCGKELDRSKCLNNTFCAEAPNWGVPRGLPLTKLQEDGNKLTIQVYIQVLEVVHQGPSTKNDMLDFNGFQILASQAPSVNDIFRRNPGFAKDFIPKSQVVRTAFMNLLLGLIETLNKSPQSLSVTELSNAQSELDDLTEAGFKLDWLKTKLEEVTLKSKKALSDDGSWVHQDLEERIKNVESTLSDLKVELDKEKIKSAARVTSFEFIDFFIKRFFLSCFSISKY